MTTTDEETFDRNTQKAIEANIWARDVNAKREPKAVERRAA